MLGFFRREVAWVVGGGSLVEMVAIADGLFYVGWVFGSWEWAGLGSEYGLGFVICVLLLGRSVGMGVGVM